MLPILGRQLVGTRYELKSSSLLLLLRPALHWEGRSGDELSACADEIALLDRFQNRPSILPEDWWPFFVSDKLQFVAVVRIGRLKSQVKLTKGIDKLKRF